MRVFISLGSVALLTVACGGSDSNAADGGDGSVNKDGAGMDGSGNPDGTTDSGDDGAMDGSGGGYGGCNATWTSCATCLGTNCAAELTACNANNACKNGLLALAACESMCGANCLTTFENTGNEAQDVSNCGQNNCNVCGW